ncbi:MAG: hypothetical protein HQL53_04670 [Magnetococcales bacterium]|nr:hypothetical protein [Magnetococcales bacterium]
MARSQGPVRASRYPFVKALWSIALFLLLLVDPVCAASVAAKPVGVPYQKRLTYPYTDHHEMTISIPTAGRYTLMAHSAKGTALQLVDRLAGPGPLAGEAGKSDGRLDRFLEPGAYKVVLRGHGLGDQQGKLEIFGYAEQQKEPYQRLSNAQFITTELADLQQRSYWIMLAKRQPVIIEAAGRALADLRLWERGRWLVESKVISSLITPKRGQPLQRRQLSVTLDPGLYLLSAYGGSAQPWSRNAQQYPLHIRYGVPTLPEAGVWRLKGNAMGIHRWLVPKRSNYFRLARSWLGPATLQVANYNPDRPFSPVSWETRHLDKSSRQLSVEVRSSGTFRDRRMVTVITPPGEPFTLQQFYANPSPRFTMNGRYWIHTLHAGTAEDLIDASGVILESPKGWPNRNRHRSWRVVEADAISLGIEQSWRRRFNLLKPVRLYVRVLNAGRYRLEGDGERGEFRFRPVPKPTGRGYREPHYRPLGGGQSLEVGIYELVIRPRPKAEGVVDVTLHHASVTELAGISPSRVRAALRFVDVEARSGHKYDLLMGDQGGAAAGWRIAPNPHPMTPGDEMPGVLSAGEVLTIPLRIKGHGRSNLKALSHEGQPLMLRMNGQPSASHLALHSGTYQISIHNHHDASMPFLMKLEQKRDTSKLPPMPLLQKVRKLGMKALPLLRSDVPLPLDIKRKQRASMRILVDKPGLYRMHTSGLLAMGGTLRTPLRLSLAHQKSNGIGRNVRIHSFLDRGLYLFTVQPLGRSAGHLAAHLTRAALLEGDELSDGETTRVTLQAGQGVVYPLLVKQAGTYRLHAQGRNRRRITMRLEDAQGWPLTPPGDEADVTRHLAAGRYRMVILPQDTSMRVVTRLSRQESSKEIKGHGPHLLPCNQKVTHRWSRTSARDRQPDRWRFTLTAEDAIRLDLHGGVEGVLYRGDKKQAELFPEKGWSGSLPPGDYRLDLRPPREDNRVDYRLERGCEALMVGQSRQVVAPGSVSVALGSDDLVELVSQGTFDVRAELLNGDGKLLARADDRPDDWNFLIRRRLKSGRYTLKVEPVGSDEEMTTVWVHRARDGAPEVPPPSTGKPEMQSERGQEVDENRQVPSGDGVSGPVQLNDDQRQTFAEVVTEALKQDRESLWVQEDGEMLLRGEAMRFLFSPEAPRLLHLRSNRPLMALVRMAKGKPRVLLFPEGLSLNLMVPAATHGESLLDLAPMTPGLLSGALRISTIAATEIGEGRSDPIHLTPGDVRLYRFAVQRSGPVGMALGGAADRGMVRLFDASGLELDSGRVAMQQLAAGRYYLMATLPMEDLALQAQPVVVGIKPPGEGPPPDVVQHYRQKFGAK